jgi:hypothetical protein
MDELFWKTFLDPNAFWSDGTEYQLDAEKTAARLVESGAFRPTKGGRFWANGFFKMVKTDLTENPAQPHNLAFLPEKAHGLKFNEPLKMGGRMSRAIGRLGKLTRLIPIVRGYPKVNPQAYFHQPLPPVKTSRSLLEKPFPRSTRLSLKMGLALVGQKLLTGGCHKFL